MTKLEICALDILREHLEGIADQASRDVDRFNKEIEATEDTEARENLTTNKWMAVGEQLSASKAVDKLKKIVSAARKDAAA